MRPRALLVSQLIDGPMHFSFPFTSFFSFYIKYTHNSSSAIFYFHLFKARQAITTTCKQFVCRILLDICNIFPRFYGCPAHTYFESIFQATHLYKLVFKAYNLVFIETTLFSHSYFHEFKWYLDKLCKWKKQKQKQKQLVQTDLGISTSDTWYASFRNRGNRSVQDRVMWAKSIQQARDFSTCV